MMHFVLVVRFPWANGGTDADGVNICPHRVLNVGRYIQKTSNRIRLCAFPVEFRSNSNFQCPGNDCNSGILIVRVVFPMAGGKKKRVGKRLTRSIFVSL